MSESSNPMPWINVVSPLTIRVQIDREHFLDIPLTVKKGASLMEDLAMELTRALQRTTSS